MIEYISADRAAQFFLNDPKLCLLGLADKELISLVEHGQVDELSKQSFWQAVFKDGEIVAVIKSEELNPTDLIVHIYVASKLHGKHALRSIADDFIASTCYKKIVVPVPSCCDHVLRTLGPLGFKRTSVMSQAILWREKKVDLIIYEKAVSNGK